VLRTRLRQPAGPDGINPYESLSRAIRLMIRQEGYTAFYSGLTAHLLRVVPNAAIMFLTYETVIHGFSRPRSDVNIDSE
jgi:solute carrier family 25, member 33/36